MRRGPRPAPRPRGAAARSGPDRSGPPRSSGRPGRRGRPVEQGRARARARAPARAPAAGRRRGVSRRAQERRREGRREHAGHCRPSSVTVTRGRRRARIPAWPIRSPESPPRRSCSSTSPDLLRRYAAEAPDPANPARARRLRDVGPPRLVAPAAASTRRTSSPSRRRSPSTAPAPASTGPLFLGRDTHALSEPAERTALEVLAANGVEVVISEGGAPVPTPVISHAILGHNRGRTDGARRRHRRDALAQPAGGRRHQVQPARRRPGRHRRHRRHRAARERAARRRVTASVRRIPFERARAAPNVRARDFVRPYVEGPRRGGRPRRRARRAASASASIRSAARTRTTGAPIAEEYGLDLTVVNPIVDPTFGFMPLDHDGKIRMDCSSPYAMANLVAMKDRFDLAFGNDADSDRHGIVTPSRGLMNPNHYLAVAIDWLFRNRPGWPAGAAIGKTLVSSGAHRPGRGAARAEARRGAGRLQVVRPGLLDGSLGFGGEESAGASFLRRDGTVWTTDKDGIVMDLLAVEMRARSGKDPGVLYGELAAALGAPVYARVDAPATPAEKAILKKLSPAAVAATTLAGEPIVAKLTRAPGNGAEIGGLKVVAANGWFAARPSGTEDVYKIYAESFRDEAHLAPDPRRGEGDRRGGAAAPEGPSSRSVTRPGPRRSPARRGPGAPRPRTRRPRSARTSCDLGEALRRLGRREPLRRRDAPRPSGTRAAPGARRRSARARRARRAGTSRGRAHPERRARARRARPGPRAARSCCPRRPSAPRARPPRRARAGARAGRARSGRGRARRGRASRRSARAKKVLFPEPCRPGEDDEVHARGDSRPAPGRARPRPRPAAGGRPLAAQRASPWRRPARALAAARRTSASQSEVRDEEVDELQRDRREEEHVRAPIAISTATSAGDRDGGAADPRARGAPGARRAPRRAATRPPRIAAKGWRSRSRSRSVRLRRTARCRSPSAKLVAGKRVSPSAAIAPVTPARSTAASADRERRDDAPPPRRRRGRPGRALHSAVSARAARSRKVFVRWTAITQPRAGGRVLRDPAEEDEPGADERLGDHEGERAPSAALPRRVAARERPDRPRRRARRRASERDAARSRGARTRWRSRSPARAGRSRRCRWASGGRSRRRSRWRGRTRPRRRRARLYAEHGPGEAGERGHGVSQSKRPAAAQRASRGARRARPVAAAARGRLDPARALRPSHRREELLPRGRPARGSSCGEPASRSPSTPVSLQDDAGKAERFGRLPGGRVAGAGERLPSSSGTRSPSPSTSRSATPGSGPAIPAARAWARCICAEMHGGFGALRAGHVPGRAGPPAAAQALRRGPRRHRAHRGAVDGDAPSFRRGRPAPLRRLHRSPTRYYAPVAFRFRTYGVELPWRGGGLRRGRSSRSPP